MVSTNPEEYLKEALDCVEQVYKHLSNGRDSTHQSRSDVARGLFRKHRENITVPLEPQLARIQFEEHDLFVLRGYLILSTELLAAPDNRFGHFMIRVLLEVGIEKIDALFAEDVSETHKREFRLLNSLSDLLGLKEDNYKRWFLILLNQERSHLDTDSKRIFEEAEKLLKSRQEIPLSLLKKSRHLLNRRLSNYIRDVPVPAQLMGKTDFESLNMSMSHLLHGNPISIKVALDPQFIEANRNHVLVSLWHTGLNVLIKTKPFVTDETLQKRIDEIVGDSEAVWEVLKERRKKYRENF